MWVRGLKVLKASGKGLKKENDVLIIESSFEITVNKKPIITLHCIPTHIKEMALGYLVAHNQLISISQLKSIEIENNEINITLDLNKREKNDSDEEKIEINYVNFCRLMAEFREKALLYKDTSMTHSAAIASKSDIHYFAEDIDSINVVYKVLGYALQDPETKRGAVLITTGKITKELVSIALQMDFQIVVSRFAPTDKAYDLASDNDLTLIGFARKTQFSIYTGKDAIRF